MSSGQGGRRRNRLAGIRIRVFIFDFFGAIDLYNPVIVE
jgi:hypothetical protein